MEAGAQGEHKLARGYEPVTTYSAHYIRDPGFRRAVARYLEEERRAVANEVEVLQEFTPFRKGDPSETALGTRKGMGASLDVTGPRPLTGPAM